MQDHHRIPSSLFICKKRAMLLVRACNDAVTLELPLDPTCPLLGIYSYTKRNKSIWEHRILYTIVCSNMVHNSQKVEMTQMPINWWMNKQRVLYPYNGILAIKRNRVMVHAIAEWTLKRCYSMNEAATKNYIWYNSNCMKLSSIENLRVLK